MAGECECPCNISTWPKCGSNAVLGEAPQSGHWHCSGWPGCLPPDNVTGITETPHSHARLGPLSVINQDGLHIVS